jgi:hypothetical protein
MHEYMSCIVHIDMVDTNGLQSMYLTRKAFRIVTTIGTMTDLCVP